MAEPRSWRGVCRHMRMQVVINDRAGTVVGAATDAVADHVAEILASAGHAVEVFVTKPGQLQEALRRALEMQPDALIVGGGDGSIRSAASAVARSSTALGVLPLGTVNRLARDLEIPLDYKAAAQALATARVQAIDAAEVNGRLFLCNAILGPTTRFSAARQHLRGKPGSQRFHGYIAAVRELLQYRRRVTVRVDDGAEARTLRVLSLVVSNNAYPEEPSLTMRRPELDGGVLALYASQHETGWRMVLAALKAVLGRVARDRDVVQLRSSRLTVDVRARMSVPLSIDGEVEHLATPLEFTIRPTALKVLVPEGVQ